jgi:hypothetical protein
VYELDRIFETDDVERASGIQMVDHGSESGRFTGAGGAGDQDHALVVVAELAHHRRQSQLIHARHAGGNGAKCRTDAGFLAEHVGAKAAALGGDVGEIEVVTFAQRAVALQFRVGQIAELDGNQIAVHAHHGRHADRQVQVGAALRHRQL